MSASPPPISSLFEASECSGSDIRRCRAGVPMRIRNDWFEGDLLLFVRDPTQMPPKAEASKRLWEIQIQGRFLRQVDHFYMGLEATEPVKMSLWLRGISSGMLSFIKTFEQDVHSSFGSSKNGSNVELPHIVTPMFKGVDAVYETVDGSGDEPPALGTDMIPAGPKRPKTGRPQSIRLDATYTFCTFSTFVDLGGWRIKGLPFGPAIDLTSFLKDASLRVAAYTIQKDAAAAAAAAKSRDKGLNVSVVTVDVSSNEGGGGSDSSAASGPAADGSDSAAQCSGGGVAETMVGGVEAASGGILSTAEASASDAEIVEAAQQRLLNWMAGKTAAIHKPPSGNKAAEPARDASRRKSLLGRLSISGRSLLRRSSTAGSRRSSAMQNAEMRGSIADDSVNGVPRAFAS